MGPLMAKETDKMVQNFLEIWCALDENHTKICQNIVDAVTDSINDTISIIESVNIADRGPIN